MSRSTDVNCWIAELDPLNKRREKLEEALRFHSFIFEVDSQLQWIRDREPAAKSEKLGQDLHTAQSLDKKHRKLEAELTGHAHAIDHTLAAGQVLIDQKHPQKDEVFLYKCRNFQRN
jgi:spectrin beta